MATTKRKAPSTALVFNPRRGLSVGSRSTVRKSAARRNPARKTASTLAKTNPRRRHHHRRRRNPATGAGLFVTAFMAAVGVSLFDVIAQKTIPQTSQIVRVGVKLGGAFAFQSWGNKIPLLGKYKNDIALVLAVSGGLDLLKLYVLPLVGQAWSNLAAGQSPLMFSAPAANDGTTQGIYNGQYYA